MTFLRDDDIEDTREPEEREEETAADRLAQDRNADLAEERSREIDGEMLRRELARDRRIGSYVAAMLPPGKEIA